MQIGVRLEYGWFSGRLKGLPVQRGEKMDKLQRQQPVPAGARPVLTVSRRLPDAVLERARGDYTARLNHDDAPYSGVELAHQATGADALLVCAGDPCNAATLWALPDTVRIIATFSVGTDHIDLGAAKERGIVITNTPDVVTDPTADIAMLLMLAAARRASEGERMLRAGQWTGWAPTQLLGTHLGGKRLGIIGMGRIGQALARRARAFGLSVAYHNRNPLPAALAEGATYHADPEALLAVSDVLSLHMPATPETRHWLDARRLALLPPGAIVVNTARGSVVDDEALIAALTSGRLAAAGLDVYDREPNLHPGYLALANAVLLPHLGTATIEARVAMGMRALDNLDAFFAGREPPDRVA